MLKPMFDYVLVRRDEVQEKTSGGLIVADAAKEKPSTGTVVASGDGIITDKSYPERIPTGFKKGDRILFPRFMGMEVEWDGETLFMLKAENIMAKIEV